MGEIHQPFSSKSVFLSEIYKPPLKFTSICLVAGANQIIINKQDNKIKLVVRIVSDQLLMCITVITLY